MNVDWNNIQRVHIIGIGGIGISAIARLLLHTGKTVSGTEDNPSEETLNALRAQQVAIATDLRPAALPAADCYIYSDAWLIKHPIIIEEAKRRGAHLLSYADALGSLVQNYKVIAVSGTHGKTSTTAMLVDVLEKGGLDPTAIIGSLRTKTKSNFRAGYTDYCIVEADEYRRHFLTLTPFILVITNIDADHLDYYKDIEDIQSAFRSLAQKISGDGVVVCNVHDALVQPVIANLTCRIVDYTTYFDPTLPLKVLPLHLKNAAAVLAVADILNISRLVAQEALSEFTGTWRRFEFKGIAANGAQLYDDYAHHPTEILTTLQSARAWFPDKRLVVVFQPHLYSRTEHFISAFATAFTDADEIVVAPIFAGRETEHAHISSQMLADEIRATGKQVTALDTPTAIEEYISKKTDSDDVVITMGAGDIHTISEKLAI